MAKVTPGFKLYLYQLLARELGFGKQTLIPQVEEVLAADDILVQDLECKTVQELAEACPDFLKVRVFKKGRVYVTVIRNEEWDQMLAAPPEKPAQPSKKAAGGPKTWKKKKGGKKSFKPVKPGKQRRDREAAEAAAAAERAAAEAAAQAEREAAERAEAERKAAEEAARAEREAAEAKAAPMQAAAQADREPVVTADDGPVARTIAEIMAEAREAEQAVQTGEATSVEQVEEAPEALTPEERSTQNEPNDEPETQPAPEVKAVPAQAPAPIPEQPVAPIPAAPATAKPESSLAPEPSIQAAPEPEPELDIPAAPEPEPISLTITYDPYADMERELERQRAEERPQPQRPQPAAPKAKASTPTIPLTDLPQDFGTEVSCKDALLRTLYQLLPYDVDPIAVLDEDWRMARSTGSLSGSRNRVTFPLRYLHGDGSPITATLRKTTKNSFGKQWNLTLVDGNDGTGETHVPVGMEGLPAADEGAWSDLCGGTVDVAASPIRTLTQIVVIGTWESFLGALAALAAPERWNYPGEGVGKQSRYGILREYIATIFQRTLQQDRLATSTDGSFAAFNTGLFTSLGDDIYACLAQRKGDIPWQFLGFATAGAGELGARLTGTLAELPRPATFISRIEDVVPEQERMVIIDNESILGKQLGRLPRAFLLERLENNRDAREMLARATLSPADITSLSRIIKADGNAYRRLRRALDDAIDQAMRLARASYRLAAPAFDPMAGKVKLLVPLCLVEDGTTDCALALDLQPSGAYRAAAILPLDRAYACARVISREQPSWLAARAVLD